MQEGAGTLAGAVAAAGYLHSLSQGLRDAAGSSGRQSCFGERCPRVSEA